MAMQSNTTMTKKAKKIVMLTIPLHEMGLGNIVLELSARTTASNVRGIICIGQNDPILTFGPLNSPPACPALFSLVDRVSMPGLLVRVSFGASVEIQTRPT